MRPTIARAAIALSATGALLACTQEAPAPRPAPADEQLRDGFAILVFTRTTGFRHDSIIAGAEAIVKLGERAAFVVDPTDDPADYHHVIAIASGRIYLGTTLGAMAATSSGSISDGVPPPKKIDCTVRPSVWRAKCAPRRAARSA